MKRLWTCRRSSIALIGMALLTVLGLVNKVDVSGALASICIGVAAANSAEAFKKKDDK